MWLGNIPDRAECEKSSGISVSDKQFAELKKVLESYVKVTALTGVKEFSKAELERNVWLLNSAGFNQPQMERILDVDQSTISRILIGRATNKKDEKNSQK